MGQLEVQRQRGFEIGKSLDQQGDAVKALSRKRLEFQFRNHGMYSGVLGASSVCKESGECSCAGQNRVTNTLSERGGFVRRMRQFIPIGPCGPRVRTRHGTRARSAIHVDRLTPGPGSPVSTTCNEYAMNEHMAASVAQTCDFPGITAERCNLWFWHQADLHQSALLKASAIKKAFAPTQCKGFVLGGCKSPPKSVVPLRT